MLAQEEARLLNHSFIGTEHILLGLLREGDGVGAKTLQSLGITLEAVQVKVEETIGMAGTAPSGSPPFTPRAKKVLELSCARHCNWGTAISAPSTCSWVSCAKAKASPPPSWWDSVLI